VKTLKHAATTWCYRTNMKKLACFELIYGIWFHLVSSMVYLELQLPVPIIVHLLRDNLSEVSARRSRPLSLPERPLRVVRKQLVHVANARSLASWPRLESAFSRTLAAYAAHTIATVRRYLKSISSGRNWLAGSTQVRAVSTVFTRVRISVLAPPSATGCVAISNSRKLRFSVLRIPLSTSPWPAARALVSAGNRSSSNSKFPLDLFRVVPEALVAKDSVSTKQHQNRERHTAQ